MAVVAILVFAAVHGSQAPVRGASSPSSSTGAGPSTAPTPASDVTSTAHDRIEQLAEAHDRELEQRYIDAVHSDLPNTIGILDQTLIDYGNRVCVDLWSGQTGEQIIYNSNVAGIDPYSAHLMIEEAVTSLCPTASSNLH